MSSNGVNSSVVSGEAVTFHTQGSIHSWHAVAAREWAQESGENPKVLIEPHDKFGDVVRSCRKSYNHIGVMAMRTVVGTVDESAALIIIEGEAAMARFTGRQDTDVRLAIGGTDRHDFAEIEERRGKGVTCLAQEPAWLQSTILHERLPLLKPQYRSESTAAVREAVERNDPNVIAIGPSFAMKKLGAFTLGPRQVNPRGSVTSFYLMQRDPTMQVLPQDPNKTEVRTVLSLTLPSNEDDEFKRCMEIAKQYGVNITRYIPFNGDKDKEIDGEVKKVPANNKIKVPGGLLEIAHGVYDEPTTEFRARVHHMKPVITNGHGDDFRTHILGMFPWYPEEPVKAMELDLKVHFPASTKVSHRTLL